ncbi:MAG: PEGA domain-containing protein [Candidatus Bathyarchaeota archaeon]|nr:PEGA domain-containing protein [Candidatus Bathyarchaeota archaeon A05DMB-3]MDH7606939.1 PEGA domain-containing protein [Candidatus Bathyarchaeota archaeon]
MNIEFKQTYSLTVLAYNQYGYSGYVPLYIDGQYVGTTGYTYTVTAGDHQIYVESPLYEGCLIHVFQCYYYDGNCDYNHVSRGFAQKLNMDNNLPYTEKDFQNALRLIDWNAEVILFPPSCLLKLESLTWFHPVSVCTLETGVEENTLTRRVRLQSREEY